MLVALMLITLTDCLDKEERARAFSPKCVAANFTSEQCAFLFAFAKQWKSDPDNAWIHGNVALGLTATARR